MDSSTGKSNKIRDIVRLQQILKKWKKVASNNNSNKTTTKSIKFLKKTLSFSESSSLSSSSSLPIPKGYVVVCVGKELKRFVIRTEYLSHQVFGMLLREAEEEFGFQQEGVLKFPCEVELFEKILKMMEDKRSFSSPSLLLLSQPQPQPQPQPQALPLPLPLPLQVDHHHHHDHITSNNCSPDATAADLAPAHHHPQMCR